MRRGCIRLLLAMAFQSPLFSAYAVPLSVELPQQQVKFEYPQPVSLEQLLGDVHKKAIEQQQDYQPWQAQLFELSKQSLIDKQKQQIFAKLQQLQADYPQSGASQILQQLQAMQFQYRHQVSLDYDYVQSQLNANPILQGQFQLNLFRRDNAVYFFGAVKKPQLFAHKARWYLSDYFQHIGSLKLASADNSYAYVVQPTGEVQTAQYGGWNFQPHFIAPGALVWVPFTDLPSEYQSLNAEIAQLLSNKVSHPQ